MDQQNRTTYKQGMSSQELGNYLKAIIIPVGTFLLAVIIISRFGEFGRGIVAPASSAMWISSVLTALWVPSQRQSALTKGMVSVAGYCGGLYMLKWLIGISANTSAEQLMATYSQAMPMGTGSTISGFLQSMLWILSFMTPITFCGAQVKELVSFRRTASKNKVIDQIRGIREHSNRN